MLLCITLPQLNGYVKYFDSNKRMNLLVHDKYGIILVIY